MFPANRTKFAIGTGRRFRAIARANNQRTEGKRILVETIKALTEIEGVGGVHLIGYRDESILADVIIEAGLKPKAIPA